MTTHHRKAHASAAQNAWTEHEDPAASQNNARRATGTQPEAYIRAGLNSATVVDLLQHSTNTMSPPSNLWWARASMDLWQLPRGVPQSAAAASATLAWARAAQPSTHSLSICMRTHRPALMMSGGSAGGPQHCPLGLRNHSSTDIAFSSLHSAEQYIAKGSLADLRAYR